MKIVWDNIKLEANLRERSLHFDLAYEFDWADALYQPTHPGQDGRKRTKAIGEIAGRTYAIVFSPLGTEAISIVSLRRASRKERRQYDER